MQARAFRLAARAVMAVTALLVLVAPASAVQTFINPFEPDGIHSDIRAGFRGEDIGDAFFLRNGDELQIEMFLDDVEVNIPRTFLETHVCLSAEPFTQRIPPGSCQFQKQGAASSSYDISLPPPSFPAGTVPFDDPLGSFCVQVHVRYSEPGLSLTRDGGGSAFGGWQLGRPFYGNLCFPDVPEPPPPGEGTAIVSKAGEMVGGDVVFTVTATNPTDEVAPDVVVIEALPPKLTWTVPEGCTLGAADFVARCEIGDLAGGVSVELVFSATPPADVCGSFSNFALTTVGSPIVRSADLVIVDVPCPDPPPDAVPLLLMTKEASSTSVTAPNTVSYFVTLENAGPGTATNVTFTDELSAHIEWSIGSGSNVCSLDGTTLTCFAAEVPDGVFEVLEIIGILDGGDCGSYDNTGTVTADGGSVSATAPTVEVSGCPGTAPQPSGDAGVGGEGDGEVDLPDTAADAPAPIGPQVVAVTLFAASVVILRFRRRS